jgi:hypothetical protein
MHAGIKPEQIDILITNCSIFCPTPSLASMLINKFKFRRDVQSYNLGGMGCSIGVIAIGLVRDMLQVITTRGRRGVCWGGTAARFLITTNYSFCWLLTRIISRSLPASFPGPRLWYCRQLLQTVLSPECHPAVLFSPKRDVYTS